MADAVGALKQFCRDVASGAYPEAGGVWRVVQRVFTIPSHRTSTWNGECHFFCLQSTMLRYVKPGVVTRVNMKHV